MTAHAAHFSFGIYLLAGIVFFVDLVDLLIRMYLRRAQTLPLPGRRAASTSIPLDVGDFTPYEAQLHLRPYAIIASVHNAAAQLEGFLEGLQPYRDHVWIIDDASTDDTVARLERAGIRVIQSERNRQKPAAIRALLATLPREVSTVIVLDPDARILTDPTEFLRILFEFQRSGMAALCPRITVKSEGWLTRLQRLEYWFAFSLGRKALGDFCLTSGIAVYRTDALRRVFERHSMSVYAEDLENALLLLMNGERVYYDGRVVIETEGMKTLGRLFSQRVGWHYGLIRVYLEHVRGIVGTSGRSFGFFYQYVIYMGLFVLAFHPLKIAGIFLLALSAVNGLDNLLGLQLLADVSLTSTLYFPAIYLKYTALTLLAVPLAVERGERRQLLTLVPAYVFYAVVQIVPATVGYINWFALRVWGRRVYRDHYQPAEP